MTVLRALTDIELLNVIDMPGARAEAITRWASLVLNLGGRNLADVLKENTELATQLVSAEAYAEMNDESAKTAEDKANRLGEALASLQNDIEEALNRSRK